MKGGAYTKTLTKIQVRGIFRIRDIRRNFFPKLIEIYMETPCNMADGNQHKHLLPSLLQKGEFILRETDKHESNTFSNT